MEEVAIEIELDLHYFWSLTPKQFDKHVIGFNKKLERKYKMMDEFAHLIGSYVGISFNNPKEYPEYPLSSKRTQSIKVMTDEEMEKTALRNTLALGGEIHDS